MNYYAKHAAAMAATQSRLGSALPFFNWTHPDGGSAWAIIPDSASRRADLAPGGFQLNADLVFEVLVAQFLGASVENATDLKDVMLDTEIGYLGDAYKVTDMHIRPGGLQIRVGCNSMGQNG